MAIAADRFRGDCARCAALCCMAPAFDRSEAFGIDKPALTPCPNLAEQGGCRIHEDRQTLGFGGCIVFDCAGAGQRVTQELFGGRSWRDDASLIAPMSAAYLSMRRVQELLLLLDQASRLPLSDEDAGRVSALGAELGPPDGWTPETLAAFPVEAVAAQVGVFLATLRRYVAGHQPKPSED